MVKEDSLVFALKIAAAGVPASDVLADASMIEAFFGGDLAQVDQAIVTVQRFRDRLPCGAFLNESHDVGNLDEFLGDLIRDLRVPVIDAEIVDEAEPVGDLTTELEKCKTALALAEAKLAEKNDDLVKGTLLAVKRFRSPSPTEVHAVARAVNQAAGQLGVTL